jgi:type IV pilus assembly protein PilM
VEESAIDIFPLRDFEDEEGKKTEVFFVAVRQQQVDSLETVCQIAGLKLKVVEIEPMALYRLIGNKDDSKVKAFLNLGASRSYFAVFNKGILVFYRSISIGFSAFYQDDSFSNEEDDNSYVNFNQSSEDDNLSEIISEVSRSMEYYQMQNKPDFEKIILCGGGSQIKGIDITLAEGIGRRVTLVKSLSRLVLPKHLIESAARELHQDFSVALGLAAREVV